MQWAKNKQGFTIVELLIVVVVIAILAAITIVSYNGVTSRANDAHIQSDIKQMHQALESFYITNGYYPSVEDMRSEAFRTSKLGLNNATVTPPGSTGTINYCWSNAPTSYCYVGTAAPGGSFDCGTAGEKCVGYRISYRLYKDPNTMLTNYSDN